MSITQRAAACAYDPVLAWGERAGLRALRRATLAAARGRVVEIGAGSGRNVGLYPPGLDGVLFTEPDEGMRRLLARRVARAGAPGEVSPAPADDLPVPTGSVDTVVSTLVLCTVAEPAGALAELRRVLAPGGRLLLVEHVASDRARLRAWQDRLHRPWRAVAAGCHCNRDTVAALRAAGFDTTALRPAHWRRMPPIVGPLVHGAAVPAA